MSPHPEINSSAEDSFNATKEFLDSFCDFISVVDGGLLVDWSLNAREFRNVLHEMGNPHLRFPVVHVAGTKAKGSTCSYIASILQATGLRTGLLTSPHLVDYPERIAVNGRHIAAEDLTQLVNLLRSKLSDGADSHLSIVDKMKAVFLRQKARPVTRPAMHRHSYLTGSAFLYFAQQKVDAAVIETGVGGRFDHTNLFDTLADVERPFLISVITRMGLDHKITLGETVAQITSHKAGIIRPHGLSVLAPQDLDKYNDVRAAVDAQIRSVSAPPVLDTGVTITVVPGSESLTPGGVEAEFRCDRDAISKWLVSTGSAVEGAQAELVSALTNGLRIRSPLNGRHQLQNLRAVLGCAIALGARGIPITPAQLLKGIEATRWPGRFETVSTDPLVIVDSAHDPVSVTAFAETYAELYGDRPAVALVTVMRDSKVEEMFEAVKRNIRIREVICSKSLTMGGRSNNPVESAARMSKVLQVPVTPVANRNEAALQALRCRTGEEALVVFGGFLLAGWARQVVPHLLTSGK